MRLTPAPRCPICGAGAVACGHDSPAAAAHVHPITLQEAPVSESVSDYAPLVREERKTAAGQTYYTKVPAHLARHKAVTEPEPPVTTPDPALPVGQPPVTAPVVVEEPPAAVASARGRRAAPAAT